MSHYMSCPKFCPKKKQFAISENIFAFNWITKINCRSFKQFCFRQKALMSQWVSHNGTSLAEFLSKRAVPHPRLSFLQSILLFFSLMHLDSKCCCSDLKYLFFCLVVQMKKTNCCCHLLNHKMLFLVLNLVFQNLCIAHGVYLATGSSNIENVGINVIVSQSVTLLLG